MKFAGNTDILDTINALASEKSISREAIIAAIEESAASVTRERYGNSGNMIARMDRKTGELRIYRTMKVVDSVSSADFETTLNTARMYDEKVKVGDIIEEELSHIHIERSIATDMKNAILRDIRFVEKEAEYNEFKRHEGDIISCEVRQVSRFRIIVSIGGRGVEAMMPRGGIIQSEKINVRDRINAYIQEVRRSDSDFQIILSRTSPGFVKKLLQDEVPEIADGTIEVKVVVRDPGSRAKVVVFCADSRVDVVGACVGPRGSRVNPVVNELRGEKIDIIQWHRDIEEMAKSAITPAKASRVNFLSDQNKVEIIVPDDQVSLAIGRRGQNVRLASQILGYDVAIISEETKQADAINKFNVMTKCIIDCMDVEEVVAQLLVAEGFMNVEVIAESDIESIAKIQGFDDNIAHEIKKRAIDYINNKDKKYLDIVEKYHVDERILSLLDQHRDCVLSIAPAGICTLQDLADLASDEFLDLLPKDILTKDEADSIIMSARSTIYGI